MSKQLIEKILSDTATPGEKESFEKWLDESPGNREYFNQMKVIWQRVGGVFSNVKIDKAQAHQKLNNRLQNKKPNTIQLKWLPRIAVAASVLLIISFFTLKNTGYFNSFSNVYASTGILQNFQLDDGTSVWLNKNSTLSVSDNFAKRNRTVELQGEAYFEVTHDQQKPFKVKAGKTITRVLGTKFNVRLDSTNKNVDVNLLEGKVIFYRTNFQKLGAILEPGGQATFLSSENIVFEPKTSNINFLSWKTKQLIFNETPLTQVCEDLSRCYGVVVTPGCNRKDIVLTATFRDETLDNILSSISLSLDLKTISKPNQYLLTDQTKSILK